MISFVFKPPTAVRPSAVSFDLFITNYYFGRPGILSFGEDAPKTVTLEPMWPIELPDRP